MEPTQILSRDGGRLEVCEDSVRVQLPDLSRWSVTWCSSRQLTNQQPRQQSTVDLVL